jgi:biotin transport system substrate-specific component
MSAKIGSYSSEYGRAVALRSALIKACGVALFVILTIASARARIVLPFSPVPMTMQPAAVLLAGAVLGPWLGAMSQVIYLILGASGAAVFAGMPGAGPGVLIGPTGGYLVSYPFAAFIVGKAIKKAKTVPAIALGLLSGLSLIYLSGVVHLALVARASADGALMMGLAPFIVKDLVCVAVVSILVLGLRSITRAPRER